MTYCSPKTKKSHFIDEFRHMEKTIGKSMCMHEFPNRNFVYRCSENVRDWQKERGSRYVRFASGMPCFGHSLRRVCFSPGCFRSTHNSRLGKHSRTTFRFDPNRKSEVLVSVDQEEFRIYNKRTRTCVDRGHLPPIMTRILDCVGRPK